MALADDARQEQAGRRLGHQGELDEGGGELGVGLDVDEVAVQQHREADTDGQSVDGSDERHADRGDGRKEADGLVQCTPAREVVEVVAGGEDVADAGHHHGPDAGVRIRRRQCIGHGPRTWPE